MGYSSKQIISTVTPDGELVLTLGNVDVPEPGPDEVIVRVEAAPINPSDLGLLFGPADMTTAKASGTADAPEQARELVERSPDRPDTAVRVGDRKAAVFGGGCVSVIGGPCAVEDEEHDW